MERSSRGTALVRHLLQAESPIVSPGSIRDFVIMKALVDMRMIPHAKGVEWLRRSPLTIHQTMPVRRRRRKGERRRREARRRRNRLLLRRPVRRPRRRDSRLPRCLPNPGGHRMKLKSVVIHACLVCLSVQWRCPLSTVLVLPARSIYQLRLPLTITVLVLPARWLVPLIL